MKKANRSPWWQRRWFASLWTPIPRRATLQTFAKEMKILTLALFLLLSINGHCSFPAETVNAAMLASEPLEIVGRHLGGATELDLTAADHRGVTLKLDAKTNEYLCSFTIAYYQVNRWAADSWDDEVKIGWSHRPSSGFENLNSDVGSLLGLLDEGAIKFQRTTTVRTERKTEEIRAIWNNLEFSIPRHRIAIIYPFLRDYYADYRPDTDIHIYVTKAANKPDMATPNQPPE
jgi:hypothetical protein